MSDAMIADLSEFLAKLDTYSAVATKSCAESLNKKGLDLAYTWAKEIPKATPASIKADIMRDPHLLAALTSLRLRKEGKGKLKAPEFKHEMENLLGDRQGGARYLRSGTAPCIEALGGTYRGGGASARGIHGYAQKATGLNLTTTLVHITDQPNSAKQESAERIVDDALQRAADFQVDDMEEYIARKLSEVFE